MGNTLGVGLALALCILAAGSQPVVGQPPTRVVVIHAADARPYARAGEALEAELGDRAEVTVVRVDRDDAGAPRRIAGLEPDVVATLGSQATAWALESLPGVPIVFAMVLNPVASGLVDSLERPGGRVTGAALDIPADTQFRALAEVLGARRVAVLYNPKETGDVVERAQAAARRHGIELVPISVTDRSGIDESLSQLDRSVDALWSVADRTVMARGVVERVLLHTLRRRIPFFGLSEQFVRAGALLAIVTPYDANGRQAAELVERVLDGEAPGEIPVSVPERIEVVFNPQTAERLEFTLAPVSSLALRPLE